MASIERIAKLLWVDGFQRSGRAGSTAAHTDTATGGTPERRTQTSLLSGVMGANRRFKALGGIYRTSIEKCLFALFTDEWAYCVNELQKTEYKLDILTGADCKAYTRMKAYHEYLPSDRYKWLLDCLAVLEECGTFTVTVDEIKEITIQRDFESVIIQKDYPTDFRICKTGRLFIAYAGTFERDG